nr:Retrovirus-related Pol polyprotein from transposon 17.6 [Ipomoea batatas]
MLGSVSVNRSKPIVQLSQAELYRLKEQKLCFYCREKWQYGHRCKPKTFNVITGLEEESQIEQRMGIEETISTENGLQLLESEAGDNGGEELRTTRLGMEKWRATTAAKSSEPLGWEWKNGEEAGPGVSLNSVRGYVESFRVSFIVINLPNVRNVTLNRSFGELNVQIGGDTNDTLFRVDEGKCYWDSNVFIILIFLENTKSPSTSRTCLAGLDEPVVQCTEVVMAAKTRNERNRIAVDFIVTLL